MVGVVTHNLELLQRESHSILPPHLQNNWGSAINRDLVVIDAAIGQVCSALQIAQIKKLLQGKLEMFGHE